MKFIKPILLTICFFSLLSCKKKEAEQTPPTPKGTLALHLHTNIGKLEADSGVVYYDSISGRYLKLTIAQFYISNIVAYKNDGSTIALSDVIILKNIAGEQYAVGKVPSGSYNSVSFDVGLPALINNTANPTIDSSSVTLGAQNPSMYFGAGQGYIFMNIAGGVDTTSAHSDTLAAYPFAVQLGTNSQLKHIQMPSQNFNVVADYTGYVHITCDYARLLQGVDLRLHNSNTAATPFNSDSVMVKQIFNNITSMFRYEE